MAALAALTPACDEDAPDDGRHAMVQPTDEADVLAAAAAPRVFIENSFGGAAVFDRINVVESYSTADDYNQLVPEQHDPLPAEVRSAIEAALAPLPVTWVPDLQHVIGIGDLPEYSQVGAVLTLGRPQVDGNDAWVATSLWCGGDCGIGSTHVAERSNGGAWSVTGTTGPSWIS